MATCRSGAGPRRHHCSTWHSELVESFRAAQVEQDARAEVATNGHETELAAYFGDDGQHSAVERRLNFKDWLLWTAGQHTETEHDDRADAA